MAEPKIVHEDEIDWTLGREFVKDGTSRRVHRRFPIVRGDPGPWFGQVRYDPGMRVEPHSHAANEVIYVTAGKLTLADADYGPGTAIALQAGTVYGPLIAGDEGVEFFLIMDRDPVNR